MQAAENAGKMANWEDLNIAMPLDRTATLRVLISSRDKVVGQVTISRAKLLGGRKNQKGFYVVSFAIWSFTFFLSVLYHFNNHIFADL